MTPEKFREWIVILFAALIVTLWVGMATKLYRVCKYSGDMSSGRSAMMRHVPTRMPARTKPAERPKLPTKRITKPAPTPTEEAK